MWLDKIGHVDRVQHRLVLIKVLCERCGSWPQKCYGDGYSTGWLRHFIATRRYEFFNFRSAEARDAGAGESLLSIVYPRSMRFGLLRSSYELVEKCPCVPEWIWIWKCWFLRRGGNWKTRRKTSGKEERNQRQTQPIYGVDAGVWPRATLLGGVWCAVTPAPSLFPR